MNITEHLQIDAVLADTPEKIVHFFCGGAWSRLREVWTIVPEQVLAEAERRGWECFVEAHAPRDNFAVLKEGSGLVSCYCERGAVNRATAKVFPTAELAVKDMLRRRMHELGLVPRQGAV